MHQSEKAVLTVEAAFVLPLFLLTVMTLLGFAQLQYTQLTMIGPISQTARKLARDAYLYVQTDSSEEDIEQAAAAMLTNAVSTAVAKEQLTSALEETGQNETCIVGGLEGLSLQYSEIPDEDGMVDLVVSYTVRLPVQVIPLPELPVVQRCRVHCWIGYTQEQEGQMVYVAENGTVYHLDASCSYIQISVQAVSLSEVENLRNSSGGKYYPCESCGQSAGRTVYITASGTRYHSSSTCSRIKRGVRKIPIEEVGTLPLCTRCKNNAD